MRFSAEQVEFMKEYLPKHTHAETVEEFNKRFPENAITYQQSRGFAKNHKVRSAFNGRFKPGDPAPNKGKKQTEFLTPQGIINSSKTRYKKGNKPVQTREVGALTKVDGYWRIKIAQPNKWKFLHRYVWEQANGPIPEDGAILFLDQNQDNCSLDNLVLITRSELSLINKGEGMGNNPQLNQASLYLARLQLAISEKARTNDR